MFLQISGWFVVIGSASILVLLCFFFLLFLQNSRRRFQHLQELRTIQTRFEQELLLTQLEIQEQTMKNISQEIHDNIGQTLSLVKLNLNTMDLQKEQTLPQKISNSKELLTKAIADLRSLSKSLHTDSVLASGLATAIQNELSLVEKSGVFQTRYEVKGEPLAVDPQKELLLFRIVQEALNNIIKHSKANQITIVTEFTSGRLALSIRDDGCGFALPAIQEDRIGIGLRSMKNRTQLMNGTFAVSSGPASGTLIQISIPI